MENPSEFRGKAPGIQSTKKSLYLFRNLINTTILECSMRKMGLEPTRHECHKILSLARLPVPTLPHILYVAADFLSALIYSIISLSKSQVIFFKKSFRKC